MTRLLIDASVLVSSSVSAPGTPLSRLFGAVTSGSIEFVVCDRLLEEVKRALQRPYFAQRLQPDAPELFCAALRLRGVMVSDPEDPPAGLCATPTTIIWSRSR